MRCVWMLDREDNKQQATSNKANVPAGVALLLLLIVWSWNHV
jgi:hypothetical protein